MSSKLKFTPSDRKNKSGKIIEKIINVQPIKGFINIDEVNKFYNKYKGKNDPKKFMIRIETADQFLTAKSFDYVDDELEIIIENYYSSMSQEGIDKFRNLLGFQIVTKG